MRLWRSPAVRFSLVGAWVRGALAQCRCVVWRSFILGARGGRGFPVKEPGLIALWQGDQRCGRSVGSRMDCGGCQGWSGACVLGINWGSRHSTFSGRATWSKTLLISNKLNISGHMYPWLSSRRIVKAKGGRAGGGSSDCAYKLAKKLGAQSPHPPRYPN